MSNFIYFWNHFAFILLMVGVATSALGLALVLQIYRNYETIEEKEIQSLELKSDN